MACCWAGRKTTEENHYHSFTRFHQYIIPESLFYPTASQTYRIVRSKIKRDKILVVIGGSSVMQGMGQRLNEVWSKKLQEALGDDYRVVNFAFRGGQANEVGMIAAELLSRDYKKLIFIADFVPPRLSHQPDGREFKYFFWDAYYKGLLLPNPAREKQLLTLKDAKTMEIIRGGRLDGSLYFNDLWNTLAYTTAFTVWNPFARNSGRAFYAPRKDFRDNDPGSLPLEERFLKNNEFGETAVRKNYSTIGCIQQQDGAWIADTTSPIWATMKQSVNTCFSEQLRQQTLLVVDHFNPHYVGQLSREEQECILVLHETSVRILRASGFTTNDFTEDFTVENYADYVHLSNSGGAKLSERVAVAVRDKSKQLGYIP